MRTVEYTSQVLPTLIGKDLRAYIHGIEGRLDRDNIVEHEAHISKLLKERIEKFDMGLGYRVRKICPRPWELSEEQARLLIEEHLEVLERAFCGTTMAFALINLNQHFMWAAGVGDSSVGEYVAQPSNLSYAHLNRTLHYWKRWEAALAETLRFPHVQESSGILSRHYGAPKRRAAAL